MILLQTYRWKRVGPSNMDIMILASSYRESTQSLNGMSQKDKEFAASAQLWVPRPLDMRMAFPYDKFRLEDIIVSHEDWTIASTKWLNIMVKDRIQQDLEWCAGMEKIDQKRKLWNDIYLEPDESVWVQSLMNPVLLDYFKAEWKEELDEIDDVATTFSGRLLPMTCATRRVCSIQQFPPSQNAVSKRKDKSPIM